MWKINFLFPTPYTQLSKELQNNINLHFQAFIDNRE